MLCYFHTGWVYFTSDFWGKTIDVAGPIHYSAGVLGTVPSLGPVNHTVMIVPGGSQGWLGDLFLSESSHIGKPEAGWAPLPPPGRSSNGTPAASPCSAQAIRPHKEGLLRKWVPALSLFPKVFAPEPTERGRLQKRINRFWLQCENGTFKLKFLSQSTRVYFIHKLAMFHGWKNRFQFLDADRNEGSPSFVISGQIPKREFWSHTLWSYESEVWYVAWRSILFYFKNFLHLNLLVWKYRYCFRKLECASNSYLVCSYKKDRLFAH